jgi:hypothetical protein
MVGQAPRHFCTQYLQDKATRRTSREEARAEAKLRPAEEDFQAPSRPSDKCFTVLLSLDVKLPPLSNQETQLLGIRCRLKLW